MPNRTAAEIAADAARYAIDNPSFQNLEIAHAMLQGAKAEGATADELRAAADNLRKA